MDHNPTSLSQPPVHKSKFRPSTGALLKASCASSLCPNPTKQCKEKEKRPIEVIELSDDDELPLSKTQKTRHDYGQTAELQEMLRKVEQLALEKQRRLEEENTRLKNELSAYQAMIHLNVDDVEAHILCDVCESTMWSPFILTGCGHTFCEACLNCWFDETLKQWKVQNPQMTWVLQNNHFVNSLRSAGITEIPIPQYCCPKCRVKVLRQPAPNFSLKGLVELVAQANGERNENKGPNASFVKYFGAY
ncbi:hypothetical protein D9758_015920 [Tetrapyrgos nigripes]|uniref:RING-type domain-containing protein n=1 Tax=Tetrapyrgos nigripes TaxID=182062 RepID=A0A8H5CJ66_9AGAR|nr:hypothetical protein D9758_015920 [Tetrapyrgos nigripes]